ncbi:MAG: zf-TFIIB domain-containing protein [Polyangiaceae bacterium]|nr:zf-TFIIB domain-containing protein [Polyangiaceae bacterium]
MEACGHCGGVWLRKGHDERVLKALPPEAMRIARAASMLGPAPRDTSPPVPCPVCARVMERRKAAPSDVDIDVCAEHGSWFDHGELELIAKALQGGPRAAAPQGPPPGYALPGGGATPLRGGVGAGVAVGAVAGAAAAGLLAQQQMQQMQQMQQNMQQVQQGQQASWEGAADVVEGVLEGADVVELAADGAQALGGLAGEAGSALAEAGAAEALGAAAEAAGSLAEGAGEIIGGIFSLIGGLFEGL